MNKEIIIKKIEIFRDERDWMQFHDPKNIAISIIMEATEFLEDFNGKVRKWYRSMQK